MRNEKDWTGNSKTAFVQLGASSHSEGEREENDYYATDPKAIDDLFAKEEFSGRIWECAAGGGHLAKRMRELGKEVFCSDIVDRGYEDELVDFMIDGRKWDGDIITNPPYKYCSEFILSALNRVGAGHKVAMFLKLQTLEGQDRYEKIFSKYPPRHVYVYVKRIQCGKNGDFTGTSAVCYAWFVWEKGYKGSPEIGWIAPDLTEQKYEQMSLFEEE